VVTDDEDDNDDDNDNDNNTDNAGRHSTITGASHLITRSTRHILKSPKIVWRVDRHV